MIPGPTPVPEKVLQALSKHPIGHRSKEFQELVEITTKNLQWLHQTQNDILTITGSGTAAMEAGIINTLSKGDKVICGENGKFGERWVKVAKTFGLEVIKINSEWGTALNPDEFKKILEEDKQKEIKAVILTHSETSTGVINDLKTISSYIKEHKKALSIVDCVTSLGACNVPIDEWQLDIVASGSQKGYMIPPGLSFISMSEKAWAATEESNLPKFYLDLKSYKKSLLSNSNPYTPAVNLFFALDEALKMMRDEGLENIFLRHNRHKLAMSTAMKALNLKLFADENYLSPSITAIKTGEMDAEEFRKLIKSKFDILLAGGQDHLKGKIFRVGHLGYVNDRDIITVISAISYVLLELGKITTQQAGDALMLATNCLESK
ncbi:alanine--glyoxylate aminotransferase family protein [Prochlorococcus marinus XMU1419]|uniref:pyridoxal-phosphate-dependent aminotransferase family protein n=1 Tax=Prochlorococcus marinus TaxID=1219 RepID=UPI001ADB63DF|nr:alanine--glyoxylate aminotransferase family protein [Prochlorococcus marinus]MBO8232934.1 alanine--glyoxylate aminotransferase family protein [Prochlorococcus marinus XMU1419]MBW3076420.1 aminotransferase [Prochlorococcus marinus str. XMU1419]